MIGYLRQVSDSDLRQIEAGVHDIANAYRFFNREDPVALCLEQDWHALNYLLTGESQGGSDPLGFLLTGGHEVGADRGYGRPRLLDRDFVQRLNIALQNMTDSEVGCRFDGQTFEAEDIYPGNWADEPNDETRDALVAVFQEVRQYVTRTAASNGQMIVVIT